MKKTLIILSIFSFLFSSNILLGPLADTHAIEHSIGISDKLGIAGFYTQTWSYKDKYTNTESYYTVGTLMIITGGAGFGIKHSFPGIYKDGGDEDGVYETNTARYKLYETFGPVDVDPHSISDDFKKVEIVEKLDKVKARKAAIAAFNSEKDMPEGINIKKVKRVKRS